MYIFVYYTDMYNSFYSYIILRLIHIISFCLYVCIRLFHWHVQYILQIHNIKINVYYISFSELST